jgi:hypothetical protein
MRKFPWMVEVIKQRPMSIFHPYLMEAYVAKDDSEACLSQTRQLRTGRRREGDKARADLQQIRDIRGEDERGVPPQGAISVHHLNKGIREATLALSETADAV